MSRLSAGAGIDDSKTESAFDDFPFKTTQRQYAWQNEFTLPLGTLTAGFERREEHLSTTAGFAVTERNTNSLFGIYQVRIDGHALQGNLRLDDSNQYGDKTTGSIAYGYRFAPAVRATAGYSTGFKAPSFNDLYYPGFSNPDLVPETSKNLEGGIYWNGNVETRERGAARHRLSQPRVAAHHLSMRRRLQLRAAQRESRARSKALRWASKPAPTTARPSRRRSTSSRRKTTSPASSCRAGRAGMAR